MQITARQFINKEKMMKPVNLCVFDVLPGIDMLRGKHFIFTGVKESHLLYFPLHSLHLLLIRPTIL